MFKCRNVEVSKRVNKTRNLYLRPPYTISIPATIIKCTRRHGDGKRKSINFAPNYFYTLRRDENRCFRLGLRGAYRPKRYYRAAAAVRLRLPRRQRTHAVRYSQLRGGIWLHLTVCPTPVRYGLPYSDTRLQYGFG